MGKTVRMEMYGLNGKRPEDDCDDIDPTLLGIADDADCDGFLSVDDCNDADQLIPIQDEDCDGVLVSDDCDDNDPFVQDSTNDQDCDGYDSNTDCDDFNPAMPAYDSDCDGLLDAIDGGNYIYNAGPEKNRDLS